MQSDTDDISTPCCPNMLNMKIVLNPWSVTTCSGAYVVNGAPGQKPVCVMNVLEAVHGQCEIAAFIQRDTISMYRTDGKNSRKTYLHDYVAKLLKSTDHVQPIKVRCIHLQEQFNHNWKVEVSHVSHVEGLDKMLQDYWMIVSCHWLSLSTITPAMAVRGINLNQRPSSHCFDPLLLACYLNLLTYQGSVWRKAWHT